MKSQRRILPQISGRPVHTVRVDLGSPSVSAASRGYDVEIGWSVLATRFDALRADRRLLVVTGAGVPPEFAEAVTPGAEVLTVQDGERGKRFATVGRLVAVFAERELTRRDTVVAVGGGTLTDLVGFAAGVYKRGIPWIVVPTTLVGAVDAAIGGKTGVNLGAGKNLAGVYHQPSLVVVDLATCLTLPKGHLQNGFAEIVKYGMIGHPDVLERVLAGSGKGQVPAWDILQEMVRACVEIKAGIVSRDERETEGEREILNFGHTFGHALESATRHRLSHGQAVAIGMRIACEIGLYRGSGITRPEIDRLERLLRACGLPTMLPDRSLFAELLAFARADKKRTARETLRLILPIGGFRVEGCEVPFPDLEAFARTLPAQPSARKDPE